jgi:hypothetical protein
MPRTSQEFKRLIVHRETGLFLKEDGNWTSAESEAMDFQDLITLLTGCARHRLKNAEVLIRFIDLPRGDIRLPLPTSGL